MYHEGVWKRWGIDLPLKSIPHPPCGGRGSKQAIPPTFPKDHLLCTGAIVTIDALPKTDEGKKEEIISPFLFFRTQGLLRQRFSWISLWLLYLQCQIWYLLVCQTGVFYFLNTIFSFIMLGKNDAKTNWKLPKLQQLLRVFYKGCRRFQGGLLKPLAQRRKLPYLLFLLHWEEVRTWKQMLTFSVDDKKKTFCKKDY